MNTHKNERLIEIDIIRGIGILLVVFAHALEMFFVERPINTGAGFQIWRWIYTFHMPLFFIVSGMVFRQRSTRSTIESALGLVVLAYFMHIAGWAISAGIGDEGATLRSLVVPFITASNLYTTVVWFLIALAIVQLVYHAMLCTTVKRRIFIFVTLVLLFIIGRWTERNFYEMATLLPALIFYAAGHKIIKEDGLQSRWLRSWSIIIFLVFLTIILGPLNRGCFFYPFEMCSNHPHGFAVSMASAQFGFLPAFFLSSLLGCWLVFAIGKKLISLNRSAILLSWVGRSSLDLLLINGFVLTFIQPLLRNHLAGDLALALLVSIGMTAAQLLMLPILHPVIALIVKGSRSVARLIVRPT